MASIDRYRPPREGYQPPSIPQNRQDKPSRSPSKKRDVPPAAPTPPQHSSRTSPPRPGARPNQSPAQPGSQTPRPRGDQWSFLPEEIESTPSIIDGVPLIEERLRRAKGVNFIYQAGVMLDLPQITLWVAGVFFHRFFMRYSMVQEKGGIHHYNIAATALFLANKAEENCRKTKDIIIAVAKVAQKNTKLIIDEQSKEYWRWRDSILTYEEIMLEQLTFDLMIDNPYRHLYECLRHIGLLHNKNLRQAAWAFLNDACLTAVPLLNDAREIAIAATFFASIHLSQPIDDINGEPWWKFLKGDENRCARAIGVMRQFYIENPLRKQNPTLPSPAFELEVSRRRADTHLSQPDTLSSSAATPMDVDRPSRSPRVNGGDHDGSTQKPGNDVPRSPSKRKDAEPDAEMEDGRAEKRARMSEDEEGELVED